MTYQNVAIITKYLLCVLLVGLSSSCDKQASHSTAKEEINFTEILNDHWSSYTKKFDSPNIGIALYVKNKDRESLFQTGFEKPFTMDTQFRGASVTKSFTAAAILKLFQEGKLQLDDTITQNIPSTSTPYTPNGPSFDIPNKSLITIRMLLAHRAGVFDVSNDDVPDTADAPYAGNRYIDYIEGQSEGHYNFKMEEFVGVVARHQLSYFKPGEAFHYSNTGYALLGIIIERVSGMPLHEYKKKNLLEPLGLNHSRFAATAESSEIPRPKIDYYLQLPDGLLENEFDNLSVAQAEGNIITTIKDLGDWAFQFWGQEKILTKEVFAEMTHMIPTEEVHGFYGLGCTGFPPEIGYGHNGARQGTMIYMRYHPGTKTSYVVASNVLDFTSKEHFLKQADLMIDIVRDAVAKMDN